MTASAVVLVEEPSIRVVIDHLCERGGLANLVQVLEHQGKSDLERSITRKINGWRSPVPARFIVSRDADGADRQILTMRLRELVPPHAVDRTKIRIVVPELEAWYLGDPDALVASGMISVAHASRLRGQAKFRNLCILSNAKQEFNKLVGAVGQIHAAHEIGPHLDLVNNRSPNFHAFVAALRWASAA